MPRPRIIYEWKCVEVAHDGDERGESYQDDRLCDVLRHRDTTEPEPGFRYQVYLERFEVDAVDENLIDRSEAMLGDNGILPDMVMDAFDRPYARIPKRYHAEAERCRREAKV